MFNFEPVENVANNITYRKEAFVLEHFGKESFLTAYDVNDDNTIANARVISRAEFIESLCSNSVNEIIDPRILVNSAMLKVWTYTPRPNQPLFFNYAKRKFASPIKWCTFVFKYQKGSLSVGVIRAAKTRPTLETKVYYAPLPNIYSSGNICLGSCTLPTNGSIDEISEAYLNSTKTHFNYKNLFRDPTLGCYSNYYAWLERKRTEPIKVSELSVMGTLGTFIQR
ncbi:hypothetical protein VTH8203_01536 [Vibrio thalassae]|uniref:PRTRC system protein B n=1 Tax=Vibrio thalassae TaxID=1243014 RepID=A0A240EHE3_9VIBR|nr:hypothetical protein [Vibrio thalassae]SNX47921.1 hypothetical protein VTH8203_01536 [Vibrio thalassae]